jgi:hypothetical protein
VKKPRTGTPWPAARPIARRLCAAGRGLWATGWRAPTRFLDELRERESRAVEFFTGPGLRRTHSVSRNIPQPSAGISRSVCPRSGDPASAASPNGGVKPPLHQTDPLPYAAQDTVERRRLPAQAGEPRESQSPHYSGWRRHCFLCRRPRPWVLQAAFGRSPGRARICKATYAPRVD